jgi:AcrR family transcriptional regulator
VNTPAENVLPFAEPPSLRGQQRVAKILEAATELFLREGYDATAVDTIVEQSGGSKATLYSYFPTKADLFRAVIDRVAARSTQLQPSVERDDPEDNLRDYSMRQLRTAFSEEHHALLRLIIAERERFPELAKTYFHKATRPSYDTIATYLGSLNDSGALDIDDVSEAVEYYVGMLFYSWYKRHLLFRTELPSDEDIRIRVERVMERFFRIYSTA